LILKYLEKFMQDLDQIQNGPVFGSCPAPDPKGYDKDPIKVGADLQH